MTKQARAIGRLAALAVAGMLAASGAAAGDLAAGQKKAVKCRVCHGLDGIARVPNAPNIGGESEFYLKKQLEAFRSGERQDLQMTTIAKGLSDADIDDLAEYYAAIKVTHEIPDIPK